MLPIFCIVFCHKILIPHNHEPIILLPVLFKNWYKSNRKNGKIVIFFRLLQIFLLINYFYILNVCIPAQYYYMTPYQKVPNNFTSGFSQNPPRNTKKTQKIVFLWWCFCVLRVLSMLGGPFFVYIIAITSLWCTYFLFKINFRVC